MGFDRPGYRPEADEYYLEYVVQPTWACRISRVVEAVDSASGHLLCGEGLPDRRWLYPLAGWLHGAFGWVLFLPDRRERIIARLDPCSRELAEAFGYVHPSDDEEED